MSKPFLYLGDLNGPEGNVFAVLGAAKRVAEENGMDWDSIHKEATTSDYDHVLETLKKYFDCQVLSHVETKPL